jgi:hypothetical protein
MFTKKLTKKIINDAKETVKEEVEETFDKKIPIILGVVAAGFAIWSIMEPKKAKVLAESTTVINNYYINIGGNK